MAGRIFRQALAYLGAIASGSLTGLAGMAYLAPPPPNGLRLPFDQVIWGTLTILAAASLPFLLPFLLCRWLATLMGRPGPEASGMVWAAAALIGVITLDAAFGGVLGLTLWSLVWTGVGGLVAGFVYHRLGGFTSTPDTSEALS